MASQLPDVHCWVKVISSNGFVLEDGAVNTGDVVVRYSVANDSHKVAGPLHVVGQSGRQMNEGATTPPPS